MHGVQRRMISVVNFFRIFEIVIFCFVVAICDLVHTVEAMYGLPEVLTASGKIFSEKCVMPMKLQLAFSRASLIFQKRFPDAVST